MSHARFPVHPSGDPLLSILIRDGGIIGSLVAAFPGKLGEGGATWLEKWFQAECSRDVATVPGPSKANNGVGEDLLKQLEAPEAVIPRPIRLVSAEPRYFRGFRQLTHAISFVGNLVVLEGTNSSGKTSLTEALEWLFTGQLQRRLSADQGNSKELQDCIQSQLRPAGETTWVEATFSEADGPQFALRRVLTQDYGAASTSRSTSDLYLNGAILTPADAAALLESRFASTAPLLMQHTLREFINSMPSDRRTYFERLLRMDEITALIDKAVIGDAGLKDYPSTTGSRQLAPWTTITESVVSVELRKRLKKVPGRPTRDEVEKALLLIAIDEFANVAADAVDLQGAKLLVATDQELARQSQFPMLKALTPKRALDVGAADILKPAHAEAVCAELAKKMNAAATARVAVATIRDAERVLAAPLRQLIDKGLLNDVDATQTCPVCEQDGTLSLSRLTGILSVKPLTDALAKAEQADEKARNALVECCERIEHLLAELAPLPPAEAAWTTAIAKAGEAIRTAANVAKPVCVEVFEALKPLRLALSAVGKLLGNGPLSAEQLEGELKPLVVELGKLLPTVDISVQRLAVAVNELKGAVGVQASGSAEYARRDAWLKLSDVSAELRDDLAWEGEKRDAQKRLEGARASLIVLRQVVLESRRKAFSEGMANVWSTLRGDTFSTFKDLHIPVPSGKGYPVSIQVRATLDDGTQTIEVDALRVFSESQVNVLGIAAFLTRTRGIGHSMVILDDPVQSMDEEHFKSMAGPLIAKMLSDGLQVVVLTHNETFARDLGWAHSDREGYVTLLMKHSRRKGCVVQEGNRRVTERLKLAEQHAEEGDLKPAWVTLRLALERLYTVVHTKHTPGFDPQSWANQTAEAMWDAGVGAIVEGTVTGSGRELKEILRCTAGGAHDKQVRGATDVMNACKYIRALLTPLRVGG